MTYSYVDYFALILSKLGYASGRLPYTGPICQVAQIGTEHLTCPEMTSGYQCEVRGFHEHHWISDHTINHALAGNGYACSAIKD